MTEYVRSQDEEQVVAMCVLNEDLLDRARVRIDPLMFGDGICSRLFDACCQVSDRELPYDLVNISKIDPELRKPECRAVWLPWLDSVVSPAGLDHYVNRVFDAYIRRELSWKVESFAKSIEQDETSIRTIVESHTAQVLDLVSSTSSKDVSKVSDIADGVVDTLVSPDETSIATGLPGMDQIIPGWRPGQFIIQCARPAMGKTSMLMQSAMSASADGYNVLFFSLEMSKEELVTRALCQVAGINVHDLLQHGASEQDEVSLRKAAKLVSLDKIMICDDGGMTMERIAAVARSRSRTGLDMVLIDYLGLVTPPRSNTRNDEVASISRMAKVLAKDIKVPVLAAHQLNREATKRPNQRPVLSDLRDSGALEQDADVVIGLHRDDYYHATDTAYSNSQTAEFIVLKHRNGPSGKASCRWNPNTMSFTEMF